MLDLCDVEQHDQGFMISGVTMSDQLLGCYSLLFTNAQMSQWKKCRFVGL